MITTQQRSALVQEALSWVGTPYQSGARVKGVGVDCAQILIGVYAACGLVQEFETGYYPPDWHLHRSAERYLGWVQQYLQQTTTPQPGDVALFKFGRCVSHGAIVIEINDDPAQHTVVHSYIKSGVVLASLQGSELAGRLHSYWTVK